MVKKPNNRKTRIEFISKKLGLPNAQLFLTFTDKEVKTFVDNMYNSLKDKEDYIEPESICIRCEERVISHTECGCGYDRAIFGEEDWKDDIESFSDESDRRPEDEEFIKNGYRIL